MRRAHMSSLKPTTMQCAHLAVFCVLAIAVHSGTALKCWSCDSRGNRHCGDPFNKTLVRLNDCERDRSLNPYSHQIDFVCKKYKYMYNGEEIVMRSCSTDPQLACRPSNHASDKETFCETCSEDGCNGARGLAMSLTVLLWGLIAKLL